VQNRLVEKVAGNVG